MTKERFFEINMRYNHSHGVTVSDLLKSEKIIKMIENTRCNQAPTVGDIIEYTTAHGHYYANAHIEKVYTDKGEASVCEAPYTPFVTCSEGVVSCDTSGGSWVTLQTRELEYVGTREKLFQDWGHCGACADGSFNVEVTVNVWRYKAAPLYGDYSTEAWQRMNVTHVKDSKGKYKHENGYCIYGDSVAWKSVEDYEAFKKERKAVEFKGLRDDSFVVFYYREEMNAISKEEYVSLDLPIKSKMFNGDMCLFKFGYDDEKHILNLYSYGGKCKRGGVSAYTCADLQL